jgi:malate dehydrogenase (oxaloacetate-decarboxylating)(NADP+)
MGGVGRAFARKARGLDMEIHYHNRRPLNPEEEAGATYHAELDDLLAVSDFLTLHCPATPETVGLLNAARLARLPKGCVIVNTARGNLVAVVTNGTAVLGLGNIGAAASKPVMEGKAVLFKKFANIDCFDIEVNEADPEKLADIVCALEPTFGAINLEDIKAPDCFIVERLCRERMNIPVFHDDQHGTAIVVGAAATNALHVAGKRFEDIKVVSTGGGAAGIACLDMLLKLGVRRENIWLCDIHGLVHEGRAEDMNPQKAAYGQPTDLRSLDQVIEGADLFLGLSGPGVLKPEMVARMASRPVIFALANPMPEILPEDARAVAPDAIIATGRSDYPNQVNNVLCFPFIFRGALDVGATTINDEMELACIEGIAALARATTAAAAAAAYRGETLTFGPEYLIPKPFDPRLVGVVSTSVAKAAMASGVATRPLDDLDAYKRKLDGSVFRSALIMRPVFEAAATSERRIVFAEGEDERVLRAANAMLEETTDKPILIGRPEVVAMRAERAGLPIRPDRDFEIVNPESDSRYRDYWETYHGLMARRGVTPDLARDLQDWLAARG